MHAGAAALPRSLWAIGDRQALRSEAGYYLTTFDAALELLLSQARDMDVFSRSEMQDCYEEQPVVSGGVMTAGLHFRVFVRPVTAMRTNFGSSCLPSAPPLRASSSVQPGRSQATRRPWLPSWRAAAVVVVAAAIRLKGE